MTINIHAFGTANGLIILFLVKTMAPNIQQ